ncbi:hypothetical protein [Paenirhodobacter populi]|uniref:Gfo/Idh/MocA family oxidoreductase n=1 Tax=Paenirhodobacter populi TaxID=2306993 RepID=A0A443JR71_9RHOB|nr:hypothetical protein [Sinirhodobacter populi]RWR23006.1 hypothetical protein D2T30_05090 [Sinirhodobacter populi]
MRGLIGMPKQVLTARYRREGRFLNADFDLGDFICYFETGIDRIARFDATVEVLSDDRILRLDYGTPFVMHLPATLHMTECEGDGGVKRTIYQPEGQDSFVPEWQAFHASVTRHVMPRTDIADACEDLILIEKIMTVLEG